MKALYLAAALATLSLSQPPSRPIAGTWNAKFEGRTFIRLEIKTVDGSVTGGISLGDFEVDSKGVVRRADAAPPRLRPIFGATLKESTLTFFSKDQHDTDQFELRLLDNSNADLHILLNDEDRKELAASGIPAPKPIRVTKAD